MCRSDHMKQVLKILLTNEEDNARPELVASADIAEQLRLSLSETKHLLTSMNGLGVIECNMEVDYSLLTPRGLKELTR